MANYAFIIYNLLANSQGHENRAKDIHEDEADVEGRDIGSKLTHGQPAAPGGLP